MADNSTNVNLMVNVITKGQEQLDNVNKNLEKLGKSTTASTKNAKGQEAATKAAGNTLGKQIPILRNLQPLMTGLGLGWMAGASAIAALGVGAMQANQAFQSWLAAQIGLSIATNTLTGSLKSWDASMIDLTKNTAALMMTDKEYQAAMVTLMNVTRDETIALDILSQAKKISAATGQDLQTVVENLAGAYGLTIPVYDQNHARIVNNVDALNTMSKQMMATKDDTNAYRYSVDNAWNMITENIGKNIGKLATKTVTGLKQIGIDVWILLGIGEDGWLVKAMAKFINWLGDVDWGAIWGGIGKAWSNTWTSIKSGWSSLGSWFDGLWDNIGNVWSKVWRGAVNFAIIGPINGLIGLLNKINIDIPSWVPGLGGKNLGFNIGTIPMLADGGTLTQGGSAIVGERGPELLSLPTGATVTPLGRAGADRGPIIIPVYIGNELLSSFVINELDTAVRVRGGY